MEQPVDIAIIGGGIAGLILGLTLHQQKVKCIIYELRETADIANPGAISIAPNAGRPMDRLGLHETLRPAGWDFNRFQFRDETDGLIDQIDVGGRGGYGYDSLRIVRKRLHAVLLAAVEEAAIPMVVGKKFSHIESTTASSVTFSFTDNTTATASLLIGADGIHSTVRKSMYPDVQPEYKGSLTMAARLPKNPWLKLQQQQLNTSPSEADDIGKRLRSMCINNGVAAAFLACPQSSDGEEVALGLDRPYPAQSREDWDALLSNKQRQFELMTENLETWPEMIQILLRAVTVDDMYRSWPFYALPTLDRWSDLAAGGKRIVLIGDAAHAVPPSAGQGACMAVEDAWSLGMQLGQITKDGLWAPDGAGDNKWKEKILTWEEERIQRVDRVRTLTKQIGNARLPREQREKLPPEDWFKSGEQEDLHWLYGYEFQVK